MQDLRRPLPFVPQAWSKEVRAGPSTTGPRPISAMAAAYFGTVRRMADKGIAVPGQAQQLVTNRDFPADGRSPGTCRSAGCLDGVAQPSSSIGEMDAWNRTDVLASGRLVGE